MDEVVKQLYVGTVEDARQLIGRSGWYAICVLEQAPEWWPKDWVSVPVFNPAVGRANHLNLDIVSGIIGEHIRLGDNVLVCCNMSVERSPLAVAWYLSKEMHVPLEEAYTIVERKHPITQRRLQWLG
ncbi:MAG: hypothetical protein QW453_06785 [Thermoprotei archaeon]